LPSATGIYRAWRQREALWGDYKRKNWYTRAVEISKAEKKASQRKLNAGAAARAALVAARDKAAAAASESDALSKSPDVVTPDLDPLATSKADLEAAKAAVADAQAKLAAAEADIAVHVAPTIVPDVPYEYKIENAAWATLVCGQACFNHIAIPGNLPCGKYVLQVDDAVDNACLFTKDEIEKENAKAVSEETAAPHGGDNESAEANVELVPLSLASVRQMVRAVRPVPTHLQLLFNVIDPKAEAL